MKKQALGILGLFLSFTLLFTACNSTSDSEQTTEENLDYKISLAQWSLHKSFFGDALNGDWQAFGRLLMESPDSLLQGGHG